MLHKHEVDTKINKKHEDMSGIKATEGLLFILLFASDVF